MRFRKRYGLPAIHSETSQAVVLLSTRDCPVWVLEKLKKKAKKMGITFEALVNIILLDDLAHRNMIERLLEKV